MAVAKNKLQDIYSAAVTRLAQLEDSQRQALAQMYQKYNDADETTYKDLNQNISGKQELLEQEILSFVSNSTDRIQSAVEMQCSLTNNSLNRCSQRLALATRNFEEQLNRTKLRQEVQERDSLDDLSAQFSALVEQLLMKFLQVQNEWSQQLRDKHADLRSQLEQAIVTDVTNLRDYERELTTTVQTVAMENMSRLRNEAEQADEQLRVKYQEQAEQLQTQLAKLDAAFQSHRNAIMLDAEAQAKRCSQELGSRLEKMYSKPASQLADITAKHKLEVQKSFESGKSMLSSLLGKTRTEIARAAEERSVSIDTRAKEVIRRINEDIESLMQKLSSNLNASSKLEQELQKDNEEVFEKMRSDFSELFVSFKTVMDNALDKTVNDLRKNCQLAEQEISAACKESQSSINAVSFNIQREIQPSVSQMLERTRSARKSAVEKVEHAAAGSSSVSVVKQPPPAPKQEPPLKPNIADAEIWADTEIHVEPDDLSGGAHE